MKIIITLQSLCISGLQAVGNANMQNRSMAGPAVGASPSQNRPTNYKYTANMRNPPQAMTLQHRILLYSMQFMSKVRSRLPRRC